MNTNLDIDALLAAAQETAVAAGDLTRDLFTQPRDLHNKGDQDIVTDADFAAQKLITTAIRERFPTHGFLPEEERPELPTNGPVVWIIDPVDGTQNYSRQQPLYSVSVAATQLQADGSYRSLAGAIYDPMRAELFSAGLGRGAWLNETPLTPSSVARLDEVFLGVDWSYNRQQRQSALNHAFSLGKAVKSLRSLGTAALGIAWVAAGRYDAYLNYNLKPWDVAAAALLVTEAGGQATDFSGGALPWQAPGMDCLFSNGRVHHALLQHLSQANRAVN